MGMKIDNSSYRSAVKQGIADGRFIPIGVSRPPQLRLASSTAKQRAKQKDSKINKNNNVHGVDDYELKWQWLAHPLTTNNGNHFDASTKYNVRMDESPKVMVSGRIYVLSAEWSYRNNLQPSKISRVYNTLTKNEKETFDDTSIPAIPIDIQYGAGIIAVDKMIYVIGMYKNM
jgi:hypothetical protein